MSLPSVSLLVEFCYWTYLGILAEAFLAAEDSQESLPTGFPGKLGQVELWWIAVIGQGSVLVVRRRSFPVHHPKQRDAPGGAKSQENSCARSAVAKTGHYHHQKAAG